MFLYFLFLIRLEDIPSPTSQEIWLWLSTLFAAIFGTSKFNLTFPGGTQPLLLTSFLANLHFQRYNRYWFQNCWPILLIMNLQIFLKGTLRCRFRNCSRIWSLRIGLSTHVYPEPQTYMKLRFTFGTFVGSGIPNGMGTPCGYIDGRHRSKKCHARKWTFAWHWTVLKWPKHD